MELGIKTHSTHNPITVLRPRALITRLLCSSCSKCKIARGPNHSSFKVTFCCSKRIPAFLLWFPILRRRKKEKIPFFDDPIRRETIFSFWHIFYFLPILTIKIITTTLQPPPSSHLHPNLGTRTVIRAGAIPLRTSPSRSAYCKRSQTRSTSWTRRPNCMRRRHRRPNSPAKWTLTNSSCGGCNSATRTWHLGTDTKVSKRGGFVEREDRRLHMLHWREKLLQSVISINHNIIGFEFMRKSRQGHCRKGSYDTYNPFSGLSSGQTTQQPSPAYTQQRVHQDGNRFPFPSQRSFQTPPSSLPGDVNNHTQQYVHPSEQQVPEPKKYTGSAIPSRSFKMLQAMTATTPENAGKSDHGPCLCSCNPFEPQHAVSHKFPHLVLYTFDRPERKIPL